MGGHLYSPDGEVLFRTAESFSQIKGGAIEPLGGYAKILDDQGQVKTIFESGFATRSGRGGQQYAQYGIGQPLLAVPLLWLGNVFSDFVADGFLDILDISGIQYHQRTLESYSLRFIASRFNQLIIAITAFVIYAFVTELYNHPRAGILSALTYVTSTMALPHSKTFFTEPLAGLCVLGSLALAIRGVDLYQEGRRSVSSAWVLSGFLFGYGILTRLDTIVMAPGLLLFIYLTLWRSNLGSRTEKLQCLLCWALPSTGCVVIILALNAIRFGSLFSSGYSDQAEGIQFSTPLLIGLYGLLLSSGKSLFLFSLPLILAPIGLWKLRQQNWPVTAAVSLCVILFILFHAKWRNWGGGWCWGPRHIYQVIPLLMVGLGWIFSEPSAMRERWQRLGLLILIGAGVLVNILGVSVSFMDVYAQLPTEVHTKTLFDPFYTLPRMHYFLMARGEWDLVIPGLFTSSSAVFPFIGSFVILIWGASVWGLWKTWPSTRVKG